LVCLQWLETAKLDSKKTGRSDGWLSTARKLTKQNGKLTMKVYNFPHGTLLDFHLSLVPESPFHYTGWLVRIPIRDCDNAQYGE
jgi:hypothetical protein